jgi:hypothetical protein
LVEEGLPLADSFILIFRIGQKLKNEKAKFVIRWRRRDFSWIQTIYSEIDTSKAQAKK